jgi:hypothetical protein
MFVRSRFLLPFLEQDRPGGGPQAPKPGNAPGSADDADADDAGSAPTGPGSTTGDRPAEGNDEPSRPGSTDDSVRTARGPQPKVYTQREFTSELQKRMSAAEADIAAKIRSAYELEDAKNKGELSKVIEAQANRLRELEPLEAEVKRFREAAEQRYNTAFEKLPDSIKVFAPADDAPIVEKERWLVERAMPALEQMGDAGLSAKGLSKEDDPKKKGKTHDELLVEIRNGYARDAVYREM